MTDHCKLFVISSIEYNFWMFYQNAIALCSTFLSKRTNASILNIEFPILLDREKCYLNFFQGCEYIDMRSIPEPGVV